ncbi:MAG: type II toxin-antitoxin system VapC family toxin [Flavisolibacter sp.]
MAGKIILVDTSILIDYYRKTDKEKSVWIALVRKGYSFAISVVSKYEIYSGATSNQLTFWNDVLRAVTVVPLSEASVDIAVTINNGLKKKRKQIDIADIFFCSNSRSA